MYYPQDFDKHKAIELGNLVKQAYDQYTAYKNEKPWTLKDGYELKGVITYVSKRRLRGFVARADDTGPTLLDREMDAAEREHPALLKTRDGLFRTEEPVGFLAAKGNDAYLIFRGTQTPWEFLQDLKIKMKSYPYIKNWGKVALGFSEVYAACRESFIKTLDGLGAGLNLYISGHSLGSALTTLALPDVITATHFKKPVLYNFASPRVGDNNFVTAYNALPGKKTFRIDNSSDLVTSIPLPVEIPIPLIPNGYYSHVDVPVDFNTQKESLGGNHDMDTYLDALRKAT